MKGKCRYCGAIINEACIRCDRCDVAWRDGNLQGQQEMRSKIREVFTTIKNLISLKESV